ncbi:hypothetical protein ACFL5X_03160 [Candidatus Omnitrophota bacterium]
MNKYIRFAAFFLVFVLIGTGTLRATTLRIDSPKVKLKVSPGQTVSGAIVVENLSDIAVPIRAYFEDFKYISPFDGSKEFLPQASTSFSCAPWISFSPQEFTLRPLEKRQVYYSINVPEEASGGYYSVLFFESALGPGRDEEGRAVSVIGRIGSLFFVETQDSIKAADISGINASLRDLHGTIANTGTTIIIVKPVFYIMDQAGLVVDRGKPPELFLNPGDQTNFSIGLSSDLAQGRYIAVLTFDLEGQDVVIREVTFSKDSFGAVEILDVKE